VKKKAIKIFLLSFISFIAFSINAFAAITISPTGQSYTVSGTFDDGTITKTIKTFKTIDNDSAFHVLPDKLRPGDTGAASLYDCENGGYASAEEIAIIQNGKKNGYTDMEIQIALYCQATTGTNVKSSDEFYQTICSRYVAGETVIGTGIYQITDPSGYFLRGLELYKSGSSTTYHEATTGYTGINLSFNCSSGKCYYPDKNVTIKLSEIEGLNIPSNAKILSVTAEGADSINVNYGSRTLSTVTINVVATPNTSICPTCAYVQVIVEYESSDVVSQPALCAPTATAGSGVNIINSSNMLVYSTTGSIKKIFTIYSGTGNTSNNSNTYNSVFYPNNVIVDYKENDVILANTITTIPASKSTCGITTIAPGGAIKASSNNIISDDDEEPFKDITTDWTKVTNGTACDGSSYKVTADEVSNNVDTIVNNQYCNIYCKEDVKIVIPSKAKAATNSNDQIFSGRYFTLPDLKAEGRKTCVADINIEQFFYDVYGNNINIEDVLSGKVGTKELLTSGGGSNFYYSNANNWREALEKISTSFSTPIQLNDKCCLVTYKAVCSGERSYPCPDGFSLDKSSNMCCRKSPKNGEDCVEPNPTPTTKPCTVTVQEGKAYDVCYKAYEVTLSGNSSTYEDKDVIQNCQYDALGNLIGCTGTNIYSAYDFAGAQFVKFNIKSSGNGSTTIIDYLDKSTGKANVPVVPSCNPVAISTKYNQTTINGCYIINGCACQNQTDAEMLKSCGVQTGSGLASVTTAIKNQIAVYDAIRKANYAKTLKSIEDIIACSEAYKYIIYNIKTPEVTFNYCDDYKIDYKFNGGVNENVTVEYCKNDANPTDFSCVGESETITGPIDTLPGSSLTRKISYYTCGDGYCNSTTINTIDIPINRSVKIEYTASFRANTDTKYYTILPSGVVRTSPTAVNSILLGEDGKVYPLSLGNSGNKACSYSFTFDTVGESHYETCFPELDKPMVCSFVLYNQIINPGDNDDTSTGLMYFYRPIDLYDVFPNSNNDVSEKTLARSRDVGSNWSSEKGRDTQEEIEKTGEKVYLEENLEYSYTLTPRQMAKIRAYNKKEEAKSGGYADFNLVCNNEGQECRSDFLDGEILGCEDNKCFTDNLNSNPESRDVVFKAYSDGTSWQ